MCLLPNRRCSFTFFYSARGLEVTFDTHLTMERPVRNVKAANFHLISIGQIHRLLNRMAPKTLVLALVLSRLDYCNTLHVGLPEEQIGRLQRVQNMASRMIKRVLQRDHITPHLVSLNWLPIRLSMHPWFGPRLSSGTDHHLEPDACRFNLTACSCHQEERMW